MEYDLDNRIIKVDVDNSDVEYRYDALGRRVIRKEGSTTTALIWWGNSECAEHKHTATQTVIQNDIMSHPTRLNAVIARAVDGSKFKLEWYHKNYLDHVYAVSDCYPPNCRRTVLPNCHRVIGCFTLNMVVLLPVWSY